MVGVEKDTRQMAEDPSEDTVNIMDLVPVTGTGFGGRRRTIEFMRRNIPLAHSLMTSSRNQQMARNEPFSASLHNKQTRNEIAKSQVGKSTLDNGTHLFLSNAMSRGLSSSLKLLLVTTAFSRTTCLALVVQRKRFGTATMSATNDADTEQHDNTSSSSRSARLRFVDIGANLLEDRFTAGIYRGTPRHEPDFDLIIDRATQQGVCRIVLTAGTVAESREAVAKAREWNQQYPAIKFTCTVGVHPTRCRQEFVDSEHSADDLLQELLDIATDGMTDGTVAAVGEIGLDYDRLEFCPADIQKEYLVKQLQVLAKTTGLPLFLHNRSVGTDLLEILSANRDCWNAGGVVHSFDDTLELAMQFIDDLYLYIGLNGCSLRTDESLAVVKELPLDKILLETDCPYCEVRKTHPGYQYIQTHFEAKAEKKFERGLTVKSRIEPCHIVQVAEVIAGCKGLLLKEVADACFDNTFRLYQSWTKEK